MNDDTFMNLIGFSIVSLVGTLIVFTSFVIGRILEVW